MTKEQSQQIKDMVDNFGWSAVKQHPVLGVIWKKAYADSQKYVDEAIDQG